VRCLSDGFNVLDVLKTVAHEAGTTIARAAWAWVVQRQGIVSTIIGARTMEQLEDNLGALEVKLTAEQLKTLGRGFPAGA
jgi:aryl-alcohol dehydrogenase-like predicted oxidoreductase